MIATLAAVLGTFLATVHRVLSVTTVLDSYELHLSGLSAVADNTLDLGSHQ